MKYSAVIIIVIIIFLHHHVRESSSCADETHSLHGAAENAISVIVQLVLILIVNFQIPFCHDLCSLQRAFSVTYSLWQQLLDNQTLRKACFRVNSQPETVYTTTKATHRSLDKEYNVFTLIFGLRQNTLKVCK